MPPIADHSGQALSLAVIVASVDRPDALRDLIADLDRQTQPPEHIILSVTKPDDLPQDLAARAGLQIFMGPKGSCAQRNTGLEHLPDGCDIVLFCDDDYVPSRFMAERVRAFFDANPAIVGASGCLLADGVHGPGISTASAHCMVDAYDSAPPPPLVPKRDRYGLYGCNMAFRSDAIGSIRFDERLPLYGWQEDIDFSSQIARKGRIVSTHAFAGVHRGIKQGRSSGIRVGYSQVVNPVYLTRKGTMRQGYAARIVTRNIAANLRHMLQPEPWIDRWGRVRGNFLGLFDLARGRITPERIEQL